MLFLTLATQRSGQLLTRGSSLMRHQCIINKSSGLSNSARSKSFLIGNSSNKLSSGFLFLRSRLTATATVGGGRLGGAARRQFGFMGGSSAGPGSKATSSSPSMTGKAQMSSREIISKLFRFVWPKKNAAVKARVLVAMALLIGAKVLNVAVPFLFKEVIDFLNKNTKLKDFGDSATDKALLVLAALVLGYGAARAGSALFSELRNAVFARVAQSSVTQLATQVFRHLHQLDLNFHLNRQTGALSKAIDRGTRGISFVLSAIVFNIAPTAVELVMVSGILASQFGLKYALVSVGCIGGYALFTFAVTQWRTKFRLAMNRAENEAGNKAIDSLINYETVKYFNNDEYEVRRYQDSLRLYEASSIKTSTSLAVLNFGQNAIFSAGLAAIMFMAGQGVLRGEMTVGDLVMCNGLLFQLSLPLNFLGTVYREVRQSLLDMQNMFDLTAVRSSIHDREGVHAPPALIASATASSIVFDRVKFQYSEGRELFNELSFEVPTGKKYAIVGGSGTGKSTIVRLLYRFYDPTAGRILINGQDIRDVSLHSVRQAIGVIPQDTVLFNDTIYYNIHYGNFGATREQVYEVARVSDLHETIMRMPKQYETVVGERGLKLSGGEKQRVAIARTMLKNPLIFAYDEATSSLDTITEQNILSSLKRLIESRTSICIAHRLVTVIDADAILVLENGRIVEQGSHRSLIAKPSSLYRSLWHNQSNQSNASAETRA